MPMQLAIKIKGHDIDVDALGFVGPVCEDVMAEVDTFMDLQKREQKPERWEQDQQNIQNH